jgi:MSHA biogenesis protein MshK
MSAPAAALVVLALALAPAVAVARDPMRPPQPVARAAAPRSEPPAILSAVMGAADRRIAILNGRVVRPGDRVDGMTVERVDAGGLVYVRNGARRELKLAAVPSIKRPAAATTAAALHVKEPAAATRGSAGEQ